MTCNNPTHISWSISPLISPCIKKGTNRVWVISAFSSLWFNLFSCFDTVEQHPHDDPYASNSCLILLLTCLAHFPLPRVLVLSLFFFSPTLNYRYTEILCCFWFVCRERRRNETSNFEYFPISAYASRATTNEGIIKSKPLITWLI